MEAQEYLNKNYPLTARINISNLNINGYNKSDNDKLTGSLNVSDFINLERLNCSYNKLTNLILPQNSELKVINCRNNNLTTLTINNQECLETLCCNNNNSLTTLIVVNNPSLTELYCSDCNLPTLTLTNNPQLAELRCCSNQLPKLSFLTTGDNENSLTNLSIWNNNLTGDLATLTPILNKFTKLEKLYLSGNNLTGSLQSLQGLSNLKELVIENTNLTSGLEYLSESLTTIYCKGTKWEQELKGYKNRDGSYDYQSWRKNHQKQTNQAINSLKTSPKENTYSGEFASQGVMLNGNQQLGNNTNLGNIITNNFQHDKQLSEEVAKLKSALAEKERDLTNNQQAIIALNTQITNKEEELTQLRKENAELINQLRLIKEKELKELKAQIKEGNKYELLDNLCEKQAEITNLERDDEEIKTSENNRKIVNNLHQDVLKFGIIIPSRQ